VLAEAMAIQQEADLEMKRQKAQKARFKARQVRGINYSIDLNDKSVQLMSMNSSQSKPLLEELRIPQAKNLSGKIKELEKEEPEL